MASCQSMRPTLFTFGLGGKTLLLIIAGLWIGSICCWAMENSNNNNYGDDDDSSATATKTICGKVSTDLQQRPSILLVSTLDGRLTALDPQNNGETLWSVATGPGPMLSSTISQIELTNNAKWVRLIPSLAGGLYKFDGEAIEPLPLSAEELLRTSFKFADNTVMTGGKESRIYGIEVQSGRIKYECTMEGCFGASGEALGDQNDILEDVIVVKRETQVVRAVEPRTGSEKWNFSVSTHHLSFQSGNEELCNDNSDFFDTAEDDDLLKAVVPEGVICRVDKSRPDKIVWRQQFNSPIVHAWKLDKGVLVPVNLFSNSHLPKQDDDLIGSDPSIYIGSFNQQLYIQESDLQVSQVTKSLKDNGRYPKVTWKPYLISADSRTTVINHGSRPSQSELPMLTYDPKQADNTALAVFNQGGNAEYPYDSGLYLYPDEEKPNQNKATTIDTTSNETIEEVELQPAEEEESVPSQAIQIVFVSIWYWWQEIVLISLLTAAAMNVLIARPYIQGMREGFRRRVEQIARARRPNILVVERRVEVPYEVQVEVPVPRTPDTASSESTVNFSRSASLNSAGGENFVSRYLTDYEPVQCLGAGGFGVVFESKNKLDENHYAVKRVKLPIREEAKKKVMREVKCLAKLDQRNIVRYYSTWLEYPPLGWQEEVDKKLKISRSQATLSCDETCSDQGSSILVSNNPLKPFDRQPRSAVDLDCMTSHADSTSTTTDNNHNLDESDDESSFNVVFSKEDESSGGIVFQDNDNDSEEESKAGSKLQKPAPSRSVSIVSNPHSKFWKEITVNDDEDDECCDAMEWDAKQLAISSQKPTPPVYLYIVMQLCQKESLRTWLRTTADSRTRLKSLSIFNEICTGVEYVHSQGVIHRDLKPSNIFFASDGTLKIGDFGLATAGRNPEEDDMLGSSTNQHLDALTPFDELEGHTEEVGTELYMSPEQLLKKPYNHKVDIYSLGLILFELLVPFSTQMERIDILTSLRKLQFPADFMSKPEYELVKSMLDHHPGVRPEASSILDMPFIRQAMADHENELDQLGDHHVAHHFGSQRRRKHLSSGGSNHSTSR